MSAQSIEAVDLTQNQTSTIIREVSRSPNPRTAVAQRETTSLRKADQPQSLAIQSETTKPSPGKTPAEMTSTSKISSSSSSLASSISKPATDSRLPVSLSDPSSVSALTPDAPAKNAIATGSEPPKQILPPAETKSPQLPSSFTLSSPTLLVAQAESIPGTTSLPRIIEAPQQTTSIGEIMNPGATRSPDSAIGRSATLLMESGPSPSPGAESSRTFPGAADGLSSNTVAGSSATIAIGTGRADADTQGTSSMPPTGVIVGASVGGFAAIVLLSVLLWLYRRRLIRHNQNQPLTPIGFGPSDKHFRHEKQASLDSSIRIPSLDLTKRPIPNSATRSRSAGPHGTEVVSSTTRLKHGRSVSTSDNPFSDVYAVAKGQPHQPGAKPLRGIMKPPPPIPAIPPRSLARTAVPPPQTIEEKTSSASNTSSIVSTCFNLQRDKFRSDPFDLEIATSKLLSRPLPNYRASSIYIGDGAAPECDSDEEDLAHRRMRPAWDSPTLPGWEPDLSKYVGRAM